MLDNAVGNLGGFVILKEIIKICLCKTKAVNALLIVSKYQYKIVNDAAAVRQ